MLYVQFPRLRNPYIRERIQRMCWIFSWLTWHKLEPSERKETQLRKTSIKSNYFLNQLTRTHWGWQRWRSLQQSDLASLHICCVWVTWYYVTNPKNGSRDVPDPLPACGTFPPLLGCLTHLRCTVFDWCPGRSALFRVGPERGGEVEGWYCEKVGRETEVKI